MTTCASRSQIPSKPYWDVFFIGFQRRFQTWHGGRKASGRFRVFWGSWSSACWILPTSFIIQTSTALKKRNAEESTQNHRKDSFDAVELGTKKTSGRESCRFALPPLPKKSPWKSLARCNRIFSACAPAPSPQPPFYAGRKGRQKTVPFALRVIVRDVPRDPGSDQRCVRLCCVPLSCSSVSGCFFLSLVCTWWGSQSNKTSPPIPLCKWKNVPYGTLS